MRDRSIDLLDSSEAESLAEDEGTCPECRSSRILFDDFRGESICDACGLVVRAFAIDSKPDWSSYPAEDDERLPRIGPPRNILYGGAGLTTVIPPAFRDARGRAIPARNRHSFYRMRRLQKESTRWRPGERSLTQVVRTLERVIGLLGLPRQVKAEAALIARKAIDRGLLHGRSVEVIVGAATYAACRFAGVPRTLDELAKAADVGRKSIAQAYNAIVQAIPLRVPPPRPKDFVQRFCSELGVSNRARTEALRILEAIEAANTLGAASPPGTAAGALYIACLLCGERRSQRAIAKIAGVSEVTLRSRYECMRQFMERLAMPKGRMPKSPTAPLRVPAEGPARPAQT